MGRIYEIRRLGGGGPTPREPVSDAKFPAFQGKKQGIKPNILVIFGDDIGQTNISAYSFGLMGYRTPNIDRIAREGMMFTDYYAEQSCTAGRSTLEGLDEAKTEGWTVVDMKQDWKTVVPDKP